MKKQFKYEYSKQKSSFRIFSITLFLIQTIAIIFFSLIGHLEHSDSSAILKNTVGIVSLSSVVSLSVAVIYGILLFNKFLLKSYIGISRERTYLFPEGREKVFYGRLSSLVSQTCINFLQILIFVNYIYLFVNNLTFLKSVNSWEGVGKIFFISLLTTLLCLFMVLISLLVGQKFQSTNVSIVTGIIVVVICGNLAANVYQANFLILTILIISTALANLLVVKFLQEKIASDDLVK